VNKTRYIEKISWRWVVDCDYDYTYPCDDQCNDGYCRCGVVGGLNYVTIDLPVMVKHVADKVEDITVIERYCVGRILTSFKMWETESWEIESSGGYYGEEVDGIVFQRDNELSKAINDMLAFSDPMDKVRFVLELEYDSIEPVAGMLSAEVIDASYSSLKTPNDSYAKMVKKGEVDFVTLNDEIPIGVYKRDGDAYVLIDGYHRFTKAGLEKKVKVKIVVLSPLKGQVDN
jgi:hypothetical protein